jgi:hypothetical protein
MILFQITQSNAAINISVNEIVAYFGIIISLGAVLCYFFGMLVQGKRNAKIARIYSAGAAYLSIFIIFPSLIIYSIFYEKNLALYNGDFLLFLGLAVALAVVIIGIKLYHKKKEGKEEKREVGETFTMLKILVINSIVIGACQWVFFSIFSVAVKAVFGVFLLLILAGGAMQLESITRSSDAPSN